MKVSPRESILIVATLASLMFAGTAIIAKKKWDVLKTTKEDQAVVRRAIEMDKYVSNQKEAWEREYYEISRRLTRFPENKSMDLYWRGQLNKLAADSGVKIIRIDPTGDELDLGEVKELALVCRLWQGELKQLTRFLFDLETGDDMFDLRRLRISKQRGNKAELTGLFELNCAYMREGDTSENTASDDNEE